MNQIDKHEMWLDDLEHRLRYQENLHTLPITPDPTENSEPVVQTPEEPWNRKQWDAVKQLKSNIENLRLKFFEHIKPKEEDDDQYK